MSTTIVAPKLTRVPSRETLILFGNPKDPEVATRINKAYITGRKVEVQLRPSFDTGLGQCGKHLCHCKGICLNDYAKQA